jgi:hypothetical protein
MLTICKNPDCPRHGKAFEHSRNGRRFCTAACRVAMHRKRHAALPATVWWEDGKEPRFSTAPSRTLSRMTVASEQLSCCMVLVRGCNSFSGFSGFIPMSLRGMAFLQ